MQSRAHIEKEYAYQSNGMRLVAIVYMGAHGNAIQTYTSRDKTKGRQINRWIDR